KDLLLDKLFDLPPVRRNLLGNFDLEELMNAEQDDTLLNRLRLRYGEDLSALLVGTQSILSSQSGFVLFRQGSTALALRSPTSARNSSLPLFESTTPLRSIAVDDRSGDLLVMTGQGPQSVGPRTLICVNPRLMATRESVPSTSLAWLVDESGTL